MFNRFSRRDDKLLENSYKRFIWQNYKNIRVKRAILSEMRFKELNWMDAVTLVEQTYEECLSDNLNASDFWRMYWCSMRVFESPVSIKFIKYLKSVYPGQRCEYFNGYLSVNVNDFGWRDHYFGFLKSYLKVM